MTLSDEWLGVHTPRTTEGILIKIKSWLRQSNEQRTRTPTHSRRRKMKRRCDLKYGNGTIIIPILCPDINDYDRFRNQGCQGLWPCQGKYISADFYVTPSSSLFMVLQLCMQWRRIGRIRSQLNRQSGVEQQQSYMVSPGSPGNYLAFLFWQIRSHVYLFIFQGLYYYYYVE